jgi:Holliday junction resolvase
VRRGHQGRVDVNQREIVDLLRACGWLVRSLSMAGSGMPDLVIYKPSVGLKLCEVKTQKGKLTADQIAFTQEGWPVTILRSVEDVIGLER